MEKTVSGLAATLPGSAMEQPVGGLDAPLAPGSSRYRLRASLGRGGMGEVRLCEDSHLGRSVAMKVLRPELDSNAALQLRFLREARVQGQLEHPAVVPVYDLGRGERGEVFFTMKRVRGVTLEEILLELRGGGREPQRRYSLRRLLGAFSSVCLAVDFAHQRGVLHRDLKPANLMLGDYGEVYVLDWGIAKVIGEPLLPGPTAEPLPPPPLGATAAGEVVGTPGYLAPELLLQEEVDGRADVYALGAILYEILTLTPLHQGDTPEDLLRSTLFPREPDASALPEGPGDRPLPPELLQLCRAATARDPAARPAGARALQEAVERFLDGDRDLALRREQSSRHQEEAQGLLRRGEPGRKEALRQLGLALALDPGNGAALRTLSHLLAEPPQELPAEVQAQLHESLLRSVREGQRAAAALTLLWLLFAPLLWSMGVRERWSFWALWGLTVLAAGLTWLAGRARALWPSYLALLVGLLSGAVTCRMFGPLVLTPSLLAITGLKFSIHPRCAVRRAALWSCGLVLALCMVPDWLGWGTPAYRFGPEGMLVVPRMFNYSPGLNQGILLLSSLLSVLLPLWFINSFIDAKTRAEERLHLQTWQLRQLGGL